MKFYQMLQTIGFDEIMPAVTEMFPGTGKFRPQLQRCYDLLIQMKPVISKKKIRYRVMDIPDSNQKYIGAEDSCFQAPWQNCLGKDIVKDKGVILSDVEVVANCLVNVALQGQCPQQFTNDREILLKQD